MTDFFLINRPTLGPGDWLFPHPAGARAEFGLPGLLFLLLLHGSALLGSLIRLVWRGGAELSWGKKGGSGWWTSCEGDHAMLQCVITAPCEVSDIGSLLTIIALHCIVFHCVVLHKIRSIHDKWVILVRRRSTSVHRTFGRTRIPKTHSTLRWSDLSHYITYTWDLRRRNEKHTHCCANASNN